MVMLFYKWEILQNLESGNSDSLIYSYSSSTYPARTYILLCEQSCSTLIAETHKNHHVHNLLLILRRGDKEGDTGNVIVCFGLDGLLFESLFEHFPLVLVTIVLMVQKGS